MKRSHELPPMHEVVAFWERNGLKPGTAKHYEACVLRFLQECSRQKISPLHILTAEGVRGVAARYARRRRISLAVARASANRALRAWSVALSGLGLAVPVWCEPPVHVPQLCPLLREYVSFRQSHSNATARSIKLELDSIGAWITFLKGRGRQLRTVHLMDIDDYLVKLRRHYAVSTVSSILSSLRLFLRFLHGTG